MPESSYRRLALTLAALVVLPLAGGCGDGASARSRAPVVVPPDFSQNAAVQRLVTAKYEAAKAAPGNPVAHRSLGLALVANEALDLGELSFRNALELDPNDAESRYQVARLLGARGELNEQIEELRRVVAQDDDFFPAHYALGCALLDQGDLSGATASFKTVQAGQGPTFMGELGLGLVALESEEPKKALPLLSAAAKKYPQDQFIRFQIGQAYLALGDESRASRVLATMDKAPGRPQLRSPGSAESEGYAVNRASQISRALDLIERDQPTQAIPILRELVEEDGSDMAAANNLYVALMGAGELDSALSVIDGAIARAPDQYPAHFNRARCLLKHAERTRLEGRTAESRTQLEDALASSDEAIRLAPRFGRAQLLRGQILSALRRDGDSIEAFRKGIELGETQEPTYVDMHLPVLRFSGPDAAVALLREGIAQGGPRPRIRFELCGILLKSGRGAEARNEQKELARVAPGHHYAKLADELLAQRGY